MTGSGDHVLSPSAATPQECRGPRSAAAGYGPDDLRSQLEPSGSPRPASGVAAPQYFEFDSIEASEATESGGRVWWIRSQSCVVSYARVRSNDVLAVSDQPDEYMVLLPDASVRVTLRAGGRVVQTAGASLAVMPPGDSSVSLDTGVEVVRVFSLRSAALAGLALNRDLYQCPDPNVAPFAAWPDPAGGHRIRTYAIDDYGPDPGRFGRLFRCSTVMVNWFDLDLGPRDPSKLSPHHHDDFEQLSLQLRGDYVHHMRTPWTANMAEWREDEHRLCKSPALTIIPPPVIHTSQGVGDTPHQLIDIFGPPRRDFSARPGWVLNEAEYPAPE